MSKIRVDKFLHEQGYLETREQAKRHIMAGLVFINEKKIIKPGEQINPDEKMNVIIKGKECPYASRGGYKLEKAVQYWNLDFKDKKTLDVGSSTGGFVDASLQFGAKEVTALDVGTNQLHYKLRTNEKVKVLEQTNFRTIPDDLFAEKFDFITMDVSFISITLLIENVKKNLKEDGYFVCLIKPQFEAERTDKRNKNGVIIDSKVYEKVINKVKMSLEEHELSLIEVIDSPITGAKGNREFLGLVKHQNIKESDD